MQEKARTRLTYAAVFTVAIGWLCPVGSAAAANGGQGNVAPWRASATRVGAPSDDLRVQIAVYLSTRNAASLRTFVAQVSEPTSKNYGQYLSAREFANRFAPDPADVAAVQKLLASAGMKDIEVGAQGMFVSATATVRQLRQTFNVDQSLYLYKGKTLRANDREPALPSALAGKILYIEGLDDTTSLRTTFHHSAMRGEFAAPTSPSGRSPSLASSPAPAASTPPVTPPPVAAGLPSPYCNTYFGQQTAVLSTAADMYGTDIPWLVCGYTPQQIQAAYGIDQVKPNGKGVTIAIVDAYASPTLKDDANRYAANHGLPKLTNRNFTQIIPKGIYNVPPDQIATAYGWWLEQSLDVAAVHGSAPGADIVYIGSVDNGTSLDMALFNALYNHLADVITNSYGYNGEGVPAGYAASYDQALLAGAAQGETVLFSSGDSGDLSALNGVATGSWPATSAYATGIGGTSLALTQSDGTKSEYGWGTYRDYLAGALVNSATSVTTSGLVTTSALGYTFDAFAFYSGAGGGISLLEAQPSWQAPVVPNTLATSLNLASGQIIPEPTAQRVSPDVAMVGDPYTGYLYGETYTIAGNPISDSGCTPISDTEEYCENSIGGTSLSSPLMAGVIAILNQKRMQSGMPLVGFVNPLFYSHGSSSGSNLTGFTPVSAPASPVSVLRGYANDLTRVRVVTINSVPFLVDTVPYTIIACGYTICEGINEVFNYTSNAADWANGTTTPPGYNDVTGLGVPVMPLLIKY
jgi:subtilase family serine protease